MSTGLLQRCQRGEPAAWNELVSARAAQVYHWAVLLGLSPTDAEDAAQDVLATAVRRIHACRADEALPSWLYQITRRVVANHRRKGWLQRWLPSREAEATADEVAFQHPSGDVSAELEARRCLSRLPTELVEVLVMLEVVGLTRVEAAGILGLPVGTVASRHRRARELYQKEFDRPPAPAVAGALEETT